jgi:RNA polymerase sigma-70 factor (ECF subfamily)
MVTGEGGPVEGAHAGPATEDDEPLLLALRRRDEAAFAALIDRYQGQLVRLATLYVSNRATAEEVVQETWIGVLQGVDRFEGRSSFRTWLFRILTNQAKRRGEREARVVPFSALANPDLEGAEPAVAPERFLPASHQWAGHWAAQVADWTHTPEDRLLSHEMRTHVQRAIEALPPSQQLVITLRDVEGWTAEEVCNALTISETNQRVLLHRARSKVRQGLERYLEGT